MIAKTLPGPREALSAKAPRVIMIQIPVDKIGEVIGPKGKRINEIIALTGADIDIEDDGRVFVGSREGEGAEKAIDMIEQIVNPRLPEVGERFEGTVVKTTDVRGVRQHPAGPRRPGAHLEARPRQAALQRRGGRQGRRPAHWWRSRSIDVERGRIA